MKCNVERITPEKAKELLKLNTANFRKVDPQRVRSMVKIMRDGTFEGLNGEAIKIGPNGSGKEILKDGQTRLHAIVQSGITVKMLVISDIESDGLSLDRGKPRTVGQWLKHYGIKDANNMAAAAKWCIAHDKDMWSQRTILTGNVSDQEVVDFAIKNEVPLYACLRLAAKAKTVISATLTAPILFIGTRRGTLIDHEFTQWFVASLGTGLELTELDALYHLREKVRAQRPGHKISPHMKRIYTTMAWNKTVLGEECTANGMRIRLVGPRKTIFPDKVLEIPLEEEE